MWTNEDQWCRSHFQHVKKKSISPIFRSILVDCVSPLKTKTLYKTATSFFSQLDNNNVELVNCIRIIVGKTKVLQHCVDC